MAHYTLHLSSEFLKIWRRHHFAVNFAQARGLLQAQCSLDSIRGCIRQRCPGEFSCQGDGRQHVRNLAHAPVLGIRLRSDRKKPCSIQGCLFKLIQQFRVAVKHVALTWTGAHLLSAAHGRGHRRHGVTQECGCGWPRLGVREAAARPLPHTHRRLGIHSSAGLCGGCRDNLATRRPAVHYVALKRDPLHAHPLLQATCRALCRRAQRLGDLTHSLQLNAVNHHSNDL